MTLEFNLALRNFINYSDHHQKKIVLEIFKIVVTLCLYVYHVLIVKKLQNMDFCLTLFYMGGSNRSPPVDNRAPILVECPECAHFS